MPENGVVFRCQWPTDFTLEETQTNIHVYHPAQHKHDISSQCPFSPLLLHGSLYSVCVGESEHNVDHHTEYIDIHTQAPYL